LEKNHSQSSEGFKPVLSAIHYQVKSGHIFLTAMTRAIYRKDDKHVIVL